MMGLSQPGRKQERGAEDAKSGGTTVNNNIGNSTPDALQSKPVEYTLGYNRSSDQLLCLTGRRQNGCQSSLWNDM